MYPDDCVQSIIATPDEWWTKNDGGKLCRGALIFAFVPHVDQVPYAFEPVGRNKADEHKEARVKVSPLKVDQPLKQTELPVAAMPLHGGEVWTAYRAKVRPCLVLGSTDAPTVERELVKGMPNYLTAVHIPRIPVTDSTASRSVIPRQAGHRVHAMAVIIGA